MDNYLYFFWEKIDSKKKINFSISSLWLKPEKLLILALAQLLCKRKFLSRRQLLSKKQFLGRKLTVNAVPTIGGSLITDN